MSIYLDHNATTAPEKAVIEAMNQVHLEAWGNPSAIHQEGQKARKYLEEARAIFAKCLGVEKASQIVWTSGGTESNCTALWGAYHFFEVQKEGPKKNKLIISAGEHPSVLKTAQLMKEQEDIVLVEVPLTKSGQPDLEVLKKEIDDSTFLVSMMVANNETGVIYPYREIAQMCHEKGVLYHADAVNALTKMEFTLKDLPVDFVSLSGHKIHGPKGIGALIWRQPKILPLICGGGQERFRRAGTENVPAIVGFSKALEIYCQNCEKYRTHMQNLRDHFEQRMKKELDPVYIVGEDSPRLTNTSTLGFPGVAAQTLLINLDLDGICVSSGSACSSGSLNPSHVLLAMGYTKEEAKSIVRVSLGRHTTQEDIDRTADILVASVHKMRGK